MTGLTVFIWSTEVSFNQGGLPAGVGNRVAFEWRVISPGCNLHASDVRWRKADEP
jgi:hypothetical protein